MISTVPPTGDPEQLLRTYYADTFRPIALAGRKGKTLAAYDYAVDLFLDCAGQDITLDQITGRTLDRVIDWLSATKSRTRSTVRSANIRLRRILRAGTGLPDFERRDGQSSEPQPVPQPRSLAVFLRQTYLRERSLRDESARQLVTSVRVLDRWAEHSVTLAELCKDLLNDWIIAQEQESRWSARSIKRHRDNIMALWRYAYERGMAPNQPEYVRRVKLVQPVPDAWELCELRVILAAARTIDGYFPNGVKRSLFWGCFIRLGYDTALRWADLMTIRKTDIRPNGLVYLVQQKTGAGLVCRIRPSTIKVIEASFPPDRRYVLDWPYTRVVFYTHWKELLRAAGLPCTRRDGPQKLRRTSATHLEATNPGGASLLLGHRTPTLAMKHYLDVGKVTVSRPLPPAIDGAEDLQARAGA